MLTAAPPPDPAPQAHGNPPIIVAYNIVLPAVRKNEPHRGAVIPHWFYRCHIPAGGHRHCVLFRR